MLFKCTLKHFHDVLPGYFSATLRIALELNPELIVYPRTFYAGSSIAICLCFTEDEHSNTACVGSPNKQKHVSVVTVTKVLPPGFDINTLGEKINDV